MRVHYYICKWYANILLLVGFHQMQSTKKKDEIKFKKCFKHSDQHTFEEHVSEVNKKSGKKCHTILWLFLSFFFFLYWYVVHRTHMYTEPVHFQKEMGVYELMLNSNNLCISWMRLCECVRALCMYVCFGKFSMNQMESVSRIIQTPLCR